MGGLLHFVQRGGDWARPQPTQAPPRCTKCDNPPINGQCTNFVLFEVGNCLWSLKGLASVLFMVIENKGEIYTFLSVFSVSGRLKLFDVESC